jgi:SAM-dependent methyltransferase
MTRFARFAGWLRRALAPGTPVPGLGPGAAVPAECWDSHAAFMAVREGDGHERLKAQWVMGQQLPAAGAGRGLSGLCACCGGLTRFGDPAQPASFDVREGLACAGCGLNARMRHALALLVEGLDPATARIYLTEQASPGFVWLQQRYAHASGSEFGLDVERRARLTGWFHALGGKGELREADVTRLPDAEAVLDAIGSFDVLEHVPDYHAALREFARVLRPGGRLVLTVPFLETEAGTLVRARLREDGGVEHLLPPEIHGDPVSGGVLCYYHFGWDLLDALREAGFRRAEWVRSFAPELGHYGLWALRARR